MGRVISECVILEGVMPAPEKWVFRFAYPGPPQKRAVAQAEGTVQ